MAKTNKKIVWFFNGYSRGSTADIIKCLERTFSNHGYNTLVVTPTRSNAFINNFSIYSNRLSLFLYKCICRCFGIDGFSNKLTTKRLLRKLKHSIPTVISIHNTHPYYINIELVLSFAKKHNIPVFWTLHDEWLLTGRCCYFDANGCEKWKVGCGKCQYKKAFPRTVFCDCSRKLWERKRSILSLNKEATLITPSLWLMNMVKADNYGYKNRCICLRNPFDLSLLIPSSHIQSIQDMAKGKKIIGAAALVWNVGKGIDYLSKLADILDPTIYLVIAIGRNEYPKELSANLHMLPPIFSKKEIASFYSTLDVFVNTTLQDNAPMVNIEALACGTPVVSFDTGGAAEPIIEGVNGFIIHKKCIHDMAERVKELDKTNELQKACCESVKKYSIEYTSEEYFKRLT